MSEIVSKNRKTLRELMQAENSNFRVLKNPNNGKLFFVVGEKKGYISPNAQEKLKGDCKVDDFQYAEVSIDNGEFVPCLMVVGNYDPDKNVVKTLTL